MRNYNIVPIKNYPDDGNHLECKIELPFMIRKGEDGYFYKDKKGREIAYGYVKKKDGTYDYKIDDRWIVHIDGNRWGINQSLEMIFEIQVNKDLDKIIDYCFKVYEKSLDMELQKFNKLKADYEIRNKVIGIISLSVDDFLLWKKEQGHRPEFDTRRKYKYNDITYICISEWKNLIGFVFDEVIETKCAKENQDYALIKDHINFCMSTNTFHKEKNNI